MVNWRRSVDIYTPLHDESLALREKAGAIEREMKRAALAVDCDEDELDLLLSELAAEAIDGDEAGFDDRIDSLRSWADRERIWIGA